MRVAFTLSSSLLVPLEVWFSVLQTLMHSISSLHKVFGASEDQYKENA